MPTPLLQPIAAPQQSLFPVSPYAADLSRGALGGMIRVVRLLHMLSERAAYRAYLEPSLPGTAKHDPGHHSVMMGYDFHLASSGPKLIEVNTNAGGIWYASLCVKPQTTEFPEKLGRKLLKSFLDDYALFSMRSGSRPKCIVILDEKPLQQALYSEMLIFQTLFRKAGIAATIADPERIVAKNHGLYIDGKRIDMIYNRHCDFYLTGVELLAIRNSWLNGEVCLSPNPHGYGLLADKRRMVAWSQPELMRSLGLNERELAILAETVPETRLLESLSYDEAWRTRKQWVFKPDTGYASRGVYVGEKLTKSKLAEFNSHTTLIQQRIPPSISHGVQNEKFKTDYRLFVYQERALGVSARIYQGQVTNLRTENGGFARVRLF